MHIKRGEIYGFIGRNGAGKTTFMRMISGLSQPTEGKIRIFGSGNLSEQRRRMGCAIETPALYLNMNAHENLEVQRRLLGITDKNSVEYSLKIVGLSTTANKKVKNFSLGMKQRLEIALSLLGNPDFLILDEPMNGLDPEGIIEIRDLLLQLKQEKQITILMSSHILGELAKIATYYGIINQGMLIEEFSKQELENRCKRCLKIQVDDVKKASLILETDCHTKQYDILPDKTIRLFDYLETPGFITQQLTKQGILVNSMQLTGEDLEGYFMERMGEEQ